MEKVGGPHIDIESLQARFAGFRKEGGNSETTQPRQAIRVLKNPNMESNENFNDDMAATDFNSNARASSGATTFDATNYSTLESAITREGSFPESDHGTYFTPHVADVTNVEAGFPPLSTKHTDVAADVSKLFNASTTNATQPTSYANATSSTNKKGKANFRPLETENVMEDVELAIPLKVVEDISTRFDYTLYGYFIGKRVAFPVVEYYARTTWAKYGLKRVMMNSKGFFFFKFDTQKGLDDVLEEGPWMIRNIPIILKPWTMDTNLLKEDLTRVPVWVKLHDVPMAVFSEDGLSLIATKIGTPIMLDSFTTTMCLESWGRCSFARALIEVNSETDLKNTLVIGVPLLNGKGHTKETIRVEYEWKPPRCDTCKIFGHSCEQCPKKVTSTPNVVETDADGFKTVGNKRNSGKSVAPKGGMKVGQKFQYQPKGASTTQNVASTSSKVLNQQVPLKPKSLNATSTKAAPSSSNVNKSNVNNAHSAPQPEVTKSRTMNQNLPKDSGIMLTNSFAVFNEEMEEDPNVIQSLDEPDGEDDMLHTSDETSAFLASTSRGPTNTTGASTPELNVPHV